MQDHACWLGACAVSESCDLSSVTGLHALLVASTIRVVTKGLGAEGRGW